MGETKLPETYCVVGGGPCGLIAARSLKKQGISVDVYDRNPSIGGIWDISHPGSPVYQTCNFISDRDHSGFIGYRMSKELPEFPTWKDVLIYIRKFARRFDLEKLVRCNTEVVHAEPVTAGGQTYWRVRTSDGAERDYRGVVWACGQQQHPYLPNFEGQESFTGRLIHSSQYKEPQEFAGKRVLVVGCGNSGADIACDAATFGARAVLSVRRGYWFFPKRLFGKPTAFFYDRDVEMPAGFPDLKSMTDAEIRQMIAESVGDVTRLGLPKPGHPIGATHPVVNDQILHMISHGRLTPKPNIVKISGSTVTFADGSTEDFDVIVMATGFTVKIPWLDPGLVDWMGDEPDFHLGTFSRKVDGLYAVGILHFPGHTYAIWDQLSQLVAADAKATLTGEKADVMRYIKREYNPDLRGPVPLIDTHRNLRQVDSYALNAMFEEIRTRFGIPIPDRFDTEFYRELDTGIEPEADLSI